MFTFKLSPLGRKLNASTRPASQNKMNANNTSLMDTKGVKKEKSSVKKASDVSLTLTSKDLNSTANQVYYHNIYHQNLV